MSESPIHIIDLQTTVLEKSPEFYRENEFRIFDPNNGINWLQQLSPSNVHNIRRLYVSVHAVYNPGPHNEFLTNKPPNGPKWRELLDKVSTEIISLQEIVLYLDSEPAVNHWGPSVDVEFVRALGRLSKLADLRKLKIRGYFPKEWLQRVRNSALLAHEAPANEAPANEDLAEEAAANEALANEAPTNEAPAEEHLAEEAPANEAPANEAPANEAPANEAPAEEDPAKEPETKVARFSIQVSAKHLIFASPVFRRLLTGRWKESITYLQKGSVEVTAEIWDIEPLLILLRAIHGQYYRIPRKLALEMLAKVAVIADYYECKEPLSILVDIWIKNLENDIPTTVSRDLILWLWIAWFFQLPSQFQKTTSVAMSRSDNSIDSLGLPIPYRVIVSINIRRQEAINSLVSLLHEARDSFLHGTRGCSFECRSIIYGALTVQMQSNKLLSSKPKPSFAKLDYNSLVCRVLSLTSPQWYDSSSTYSSFGSRYAHGCSHASFGSVFATLSDTLQGLELKDFTCP